MDKTLEKNEAFELDKVILGSITTLSREKHKRKLEEDAMLTTLEGKGI